MDGRLLALARDEKEKLRLRAVDEDARRHRIAYERVPALRGIDARLAALVGEAAGSIWGGGRTIDEIRRESLDLRAERTELLAEQGYPPGWLDGAWTCAKCRDTGFVEGRMCQCLRELYEEQRSKALSALLKLGNESFETFDLSYYSDELDPARGVSDRAQMETIYRVCVNYARTFGPNSRNLLFRGEPGLGKTYLSACIARMVSEKGYSVVYETTVDALTAYEAQKFRSSEEADDRVERLTGCELLILDDLGTEMITEFTKSALYTLINARLLSGKKTIISTNLTAGDMARVYTPQICSRLEGEYQDLPFVGTDIRILKKERGL